MATSAASRSRWIRAPSSPHSPSPFRQSSACWAAYASSASPLRRASSSLTHGAKSSGRSSRKGQAEVGQIALRVDEEHGDAVEQRLLDEREAEAGLAAARHPDAHGMGDEILGVVEEEPGLGLLGPEVVRTPEVEDAELLEVGGGGFPRGALRGRGARGPARLGPAGLARAGRHGQSQRGSSRGPLSSAAGLAPTRDARGARTDQPPSRGAPQSDRAPRRRGGTTRTLWNGIGGRPGWPVAAAPQARPTSSRSARSVA